MGKAIGIDLGTYNSAAAIAIGRDNLEMVLSRYGESSYGKNFPSFVLFDYNGKKQSVGNPAKEQRAFNHELVIWGAKRLVGISYETAKKDKELDRFKYNIEEGPGGSILIKVGPERFSPSHILEFILREIKEDAENVGFNSLIGDEIDRAVVSVPAYFDATRIGYITEATYKAGFKEVETIPEPTAAAMVYGLELKKEGKILTFDIGAGTLDVTIMQFLYEDSELICSELSTSGDPKLGGIDMDEIMTKYILDKYKLYHIEKNFRSMAMLNAGVERAKIMLSSKLSYPIDIPPQQTVDLTRKELEEVIEPLLDKCRGPIRVALKEAGLEAKDLDHVLFVGGPTYMPCVRAMVKDELKNAGATRELLRELEVLNEKGFPVNPMECVAKGASLKAARIAKPNVQSEPYAYGTKFWPIPGTDDYFCTIIPSNSNYPIKCSTTIKHYNPTTKRVPIPLIKRLSYDEQGKTLYRYYHLGDYDCYIKSTGEKPLVDITMELTADKILVTTFTHKQTNESLVLERLDELKGKEIILQEHTWKIEHEDDDGDDNDNGDKRIQIDEWTREQLDRAIHVARMLIEDYAAQSQNNKVIKKRAELESLIQNVKQPNDARFIMNRMYELLNLLKNSRDINEDDYHFYRQELRKIV